MQIDVEARYSALLAQRVIAALRDRGIDGTYCETREDALRTALDMADGADLIACGGSATLDEIGLRRALSKGEYSFLDPAAQQGAQNMRDAARRALDADVFFTGCNAIAETGELVNADGIGNRLAALAFGPRRVILVAGINKVAPTLDAALERVRTRAARMILLRFRDFDDFDALENAARRAAGQTNVISASMPAGRICVLLVGEVLGY